MDALGRSDAPSEPESALLPTLPITMHHQLLAYAKTMGPGERNIYVRTLDGSIDRELTNLEGVETLPAWSPDGSQLVFSASVNSPEPSKCVPQHAIPSCNYDLYIINVDGTNLQRLTATVDAQERMTSWSPDGAQIVFQSGGMVHGCGCSPLHIINVDGTGNTPITPPETFLAYPSWNHATNSIAVEAGGTSFNMLFTIDPERLVVRPVATTPAAFQASAPAWSPNGTELAFVSVSPASRGFLAIMGMNATNDGGTLQQLALKVNVDRAFAPTWSPDGQYLAFASDVGSAETLYIVKRDGTGLTQITDDATTYYAPAWSPVPTP
jgi:TolB protein